MLKLFQAQSLQSLFAVLLAVAAVFSAINCQGHDYSFRWNILCLFLLLLLTGVYLFFHHSKQRSLSRNPAWISYCFLALWAFASLLWSPVPSDSLLFWSTFPVGVFALYLGYQATPQQWLLFKSLLLPLVLIVACYTLYQHQVLHISRPGGFFLNWNTNAALMGLLIIPFSFNFLSTQTVIVRHGLGLLFLITAVAMGLTQSRGGVLVLIIGLGPVCWMHYQQSKNILYYYP